MRMLLHSRSLAIAAVLTLAAPAVAHEFPTSESVLQIDGSTVQSRLSVNLLELGGVDANGDERISYDELDRAIEPLFRTIKDHYRIDAAGQPPLSINADRSAIVEQHVLQIDLRYTFSRPVTSIVVTSTLEQILGPGHQHIVSMKIDDAFRRAVLDASHPSAPFEARRFTAGRLVAVVVALLGIAALIVYRRRSAQARTTISRPPHHRNAAERS